MALLALTLATRRVIRQCLRNAGRSGVFIADPFCTLVANRTAVDQGSLAFALDAMIVGGAALAIVACSITILVHATDGRLACVNRAGIAVVAVDSVSLALPVTGIAGHLAAHIAATIYLAMGAGPRDAGINRARIAVVARHGDMDASLRATTVHRARIRIVAVQCCVGAAGAWVARIDRTGVVVVAVQCCVGTTGAWAAGIDRTSIVVVAVQCSVSAAGAWAAGIDGA